MRPDQRVKDLDGSELGRALSSATPAPELCVYPTAPRAVRRHHTDGDAGLDHGAHLAAEEPHTGPRPADAIRPSGAERRVRAAIARRCPVADRRARQQSMPVRPERGYKGDGQPNRTSGSPTRRAWSARATQSTVSAGSWSGSAQTSSVHLPGSVMAG